MSPLLDSFRPIIGFILLLSMPFQSVQSAEPPIDTNSITVPVIETDISNNTLFKRALIDKALHEDSIAELELQLGPYSAKLGEAYLELGFILRTLEQHHEAALAFDRALQSVRISNGLNDLSQLSILQELIVSNQEQADWDAVDSNTHLIFHIARKNLTAGDERRIQAAQQLGRWQIKTAREELATGFSTAAADASTLYKNEIIALERVEDYTGKNMHLASMYLGQASAQLLAAKITLNKPLSEYQTGEQRTTMRNECRITRAPDGTAIQICSMVERPNINYYLVPSNRKTRAIEIHLRSVRDSIQHSYELLQNQFQPDQRKMLLTEVQELTASYNKFIEDNSL